MSDLFSDLVDGSGRDYFYDLESAPGGLTPNLATLTISGLAPTVFEQVSVFRSPATAVMTINGLPFAPDFNVSPAPAALSIAGQIPGELREIIVTPAVPDLDYSEPVSHAPTILFINTVMPDTAVIALRSLELNVTPGGNIAFIEPSTALVQFSQLPVTLIFHPVGLGELSLVGHAPTLATELILGSDEELHPDFGVPTGTLIIQGLAPTLSRPFGWIDVDPQPATTWTTTTSAAA